MRTVLFYSILWSSRPGSNRRPARYECAALPTEPRKQKNTKAAHKLPNIAHAKSTPSYLHFMISPRNYSLQKQCQNDKYS